MALQVPLLVEFLSLCNLFNLLFPGDASGKEPVGQPAFPGQEDPLEEGRTTHSNILA